MYSTARFTFYNLWLHILWSFRIYTAIFIPLSDWDSCCWLAATNEAVFQQIVRFLGLFLLQLRPLIAGLPSSNRRRVKHSWWVHSCIQFLSSSLLAPLHTRLRSAYFLLRNLNLVFYKFLVIIMFRKGSEELRWCHFHPCMMDNNVRGCGGEFESTEYSSLDLKSADTSPPTRMLPWHGQEIRNLGKSPQSQLQVPLAYKNSGELKRHHPWASAIGHLFHLWREFEGRLSPLAMWRRFKSVCRGYKLLIYPIFDETAPISKKRLLQRFRVMCKDELREQGCC
jgi:hypothetical protein